MKYRTNYAVSGMVLEDLNKFIIVIIVIIIRDQTVADLTRFSQITHTCPDRTNLFI